MRNIYNDISNFLNHNSMAIYKYYNDYRRFRSHRSHPLNNATRRLYFFRSLLYPIAAALFLFPISRTDTRHRKNRRTPS